MSSVSPNPNPNPNPSLNPSSSENPPVARRRSKGRQKIEMKKMSNESNLQVTFSKRRTGLFKKASELCTLCGAEVALIVFSPGDKAFSFGHPNVEATIDRYLSRGTARPRPSASTQIMEAHRNANVRDLNAQLTQVMEQLEAEKKRGEELTRRRKEMEATCWWVAPHDALSRDQLAIVKARLEEIKKILAREADRLLIQTAANAQYYACSSSSLPPPRPSLPVAAPPAQVFRPAPAPVFRPPPAPVFRPPLSLPLPPPPPPQHPIIQNPMFDGNMMPPPLPPQQLPMPVPQGFESLDNNMGGYGGQGY